MCPTLVTYQHLIVKIPMFEVNQDFCSVSAKAELPTGCFTLPKAAEMFWVLHLAPLPAFDVNNNDLI